jgi:hypothetical protein
MPKKNKICIDCGNSCSNLRCKPCSGKAKRIPVANRFWDKVNKNGLIQSHMNTPCWEWTAFRNPQGYGMVGTENKTELAHRISYLLCYNELKDFILHKCDNPACVNPEHLYQGNAKDNADDMHKRGRYVYPPTGDNHWTRKYPERSKPNIKIEQKARGERIGIHVLTDEKVLEIRASYIPYKVSIPKLAKKYGVGLSTLRAVIERKTWKHI